MKRFLLGIVLGTLVMFIFGAVFWMNPMPYRALPAVSDDDAVGATLRATFPESGTYLIPNPLDDVKRLEELTQRGPIAMVHIQREGMKPMEPRVFIQGFIHELVTVALLALILKIALPALGGYLTRVVFVSMLGLLCAFYADFSRPIWWNHPWTFFLIAFVYDFGAWFATGLVLAAFIKPEPWLD